MFMYCFARAYALENDKGLTTNRWVGEEIFDLPNHGGHGEETLPQHYHQDQDSLIYTRKQAKEWFTFKPEVLEKLQQYTTPYIAAHRRVGDYAALEYVVVSRDSYWKACREFGYDPNRVRMFEDATATGQVPQDKWQFLPDFYQMTQAEVLFRGNSTFSWWAATLSDAKVYSPVIEPHMIGGREWDCKFVEGNHPKFANLPGITDLHLKDE